MALTQFSFSRIETRAVPAVIADDAVSETKTPSGSNGTTTAAATGSRNICRVATDTAVYVSFGPAPDASTDTSRFYMPAGAIEYYVVDSGWIAAVVTA